MTFIGLPCFANKLFSSSAYKSLANRRHYILKATSTHVAQNLQLSNSCRSGLLFRGFITSNTSRFPHLKKFEGKSSKFIQRRFTSSKNMEKFITSSYFVNGEWKTAKSTYPVHNPYSGEVIAQAANCTQSETQSAIQHASNAFKKWKNTTGKVYWAEVSIYPAELDQSQFVIELNQRAAVLQKWHHLMLENKQALAELITLENGKPIRESAVEIAFATGFLEWLAEEAKRSYGITIPSPHPKKRMLTIKQPIGVAGMITPWNSPSAMITRKAGAAIAAGCTVVLKSAEDTPFSAYALAKLAKEAGLPDGVLNILSSSRHHVPEIGQVICQSKDVTALSFTGSTATGKILLRQSADTVKKMSLELGGLAPFIVFDSADLEKAVANTMICKFRYMGQTCVCANRIYVQEGIHDQYIEKLVKVMNDELKAGNPMEHETTHGPMINHKALCKVESQVNDAVKKGARVVVGGAKGSEGTNFFQPTLLTDVTPDMLCYCEETFGPIAAVVKFQTEDEVVKLANNARVGLAGYFFSNDVSQCWRVAEELEVGMVGINEGFMNTQEAPFGGVKESGLGREGSCYALDEFTEMKYMCWGI